MAETPQSDIISIPLPPPSPNPPPPPPPAYTAQVLIYHICNI